MHIDGGIIAGGQARRMGGIDKGLVPFNGKPLAAWVFKTLQPHVRDIWINCNRNPEDYRQISPHICSDTSEEALGPLAGLLAIMEASAADYLLISPCDTPFLPDRFGPALLAHIHAWKAEGHPGKPPPIAAVADGRKHPLHLCISRAYRENLAASLANGQRRAHAWLEEQNPVWVNFENGDSGFKNVNYLDDLSD